MNVSVSLPPAFAAGFSSSSVILWAALLAITLLLVSVAVALVLWLEGQRARPHRLGVPDPLRSGRVTRQEAHERAEQLLAEMLTPEQLQQLKSNGFLAVPSPGHPGRVYHIPYRPDRVTVYEGGRPVLKLCVYPCKHLPLADRVLVHKLMIEGDEAGYLRTANHLRV